MAARLPSDLQNLAVPRFCAIHLLGSTHSVRTGYTSENIIKLPGDCFDEQHSNKGYQPGFMDMDVVDDGFGEEVQDSLQAADDCETSKENLPDTLRAEQQIPRDRDDTTCRSRSNTGRGFERMTMLATTPWTKFHTKTMQRRGRVVEQAYYCMTPLIS